MSVQVKDYLSILSQIIDLYKSVRKTANANGISNEELSKADVFLQTIYVDPLATNNQPVAPILPPELASPPPAPVIQPPSSPRQQSARMYNELYPMPVPDDETLKITTPFVSGDVIYWEGNNDSSSRWIVEKAGILPPLGNDYINLRILRTIQ